MRLFDPCCFVTAVLSEVFEHDELPWAANWPLLSRAVLEGYDSVSPLTGQEWRAVPTMVIKADTFIAFISVGSFSICL